MNYTRLPRSHLTITCTLVRILLQPLSHVRHESTDSVMSGQSERYADAMGWPAPLIHIDGPCGAPAQNYRDYKVLLLVVSIPHLV